MSSGKLAVTDGSVIVERECAGMVSALVNGIAQHGGIDKLAVHNAAWGKKVKNKNRPLFKGYNFNLECLVSDEESC